MKFLFVCRDCGSPRVYADAFVSLNDPKDIQIYDNTFCQDCEKDKTSVVEVAVPDGFDITKDYFHEEWA